MLPNKSRTLNTVEKLPGMEGSIVRMEGLEPPWVAPLDPKSSASTNFATSAGLFRLSLPGNRCRFIQGLASKMDGKVMEYCQIEKVFMGFAKYVPDRSIWSRDALFGGRWGLLYRFVMLAIQGAAERRLIMGTLKMSCS